MKFLPVSRLKLLFKVQLKRHLVWKDFPKAQAETIPPGHPTALPAQGRPV